MVKRASEMKVDVYGKPLPNCSTSWSLRALLCHCGRVARHYDDAARSLKRACLRRIARPLPSDHRRVGRNSASSVQQYSFIILLIRIHSRKKEAKLDQIVVEMGAWWRAASQHGAFPPAPSEC